MKILFLNHNIIWKGGFFRAFHWGRYLVKSGHEVTILTISEDKYFRFNSASIEGVKIVRTPDLLRGRLRSGWDLYDTILRIAYLSTKNFDIVHCVDSRPNVIIPGLFLKLFRSSKLVLDWGDWWGRGGTITVRSKCLLEKLFAPIETFFEEGFRLKADGNIVLTSALAKRASKLGVKPELLEQIPHGADVDRIVPQNKFVCRSKLKLQNDRYVLGYVGTIFPQDLDFLLSAFRLMFEQEENIILLLIGYFNGKLPSDLVEQGKVVLTGKIDYHTLQEYIAACDVMLLPLKNSIANQGRWPSKVCDYLASGRPVIASDVGDLRYLFEDGKAGLLTNDDPIDFAEKTLIALRSNRLDEMGNNSRMLAQEMLSWKILTNKLERFYLRIPKK